MGRGKQEQVKEKVPGDQALCQEPAVCTPSLFGCPGGARPWFTTLKAQPSPKSYFLKADDRCPNIHPLLAPCFCHNCSDGLILEAKFQPWAFARLAL